MKLKRSILAIVTAGALSSWVSAEVLYTVTPIGGAGVIAMGLNDLGQVVGYGPGPNGLNQAFIWQNGVITHLGVEPGYLTSEAHGINNAGQVVGSSNSSNASLSFIWSGGTFSHLSGLPLSSAVAVEINDSGQVAARTGYSTAFTWSNGTATELIPFPGTYFPSPGAGQRIGPNAINNSGEVVGTIFVGLRPHAFLWSEGVMADLGPSSTAAGINDAGQVAGSIFQGESYHGSIWDNGAIQDLGALPGFSSSHALGISGSGEVIGYSALTENSGPWRAVIWRNGLITDLNDVIEPGFGGLQMAYAINDVGQIIARSADPNGDVFTFLLTPVPEPGTLGLLAIGSFASFYRRRRA